ncbi:MAG: hypothetical protein ACRYGR_07785 [Janthinobacterium lividum]
MSIKLNKLLKLTTFSIFMTYTSIFNIRATEVESAKFVPLFNINSSSKNFNSLKLGQGSRINVYAQDASTSDPTAYYSSSSGLFSPSKPPFIKQVLIFQDLTNGFSDLDMEIATLPGVKFTPDSNGDFTSYKEGSPEFDAAHTYARVRETYDMWYATLDSIVQEYKDPIAKKKIQYWDGRGYGKLMIYPHAGLDANAYYSRLDTTRSLKFFDFISQEKKVALRKLISTCRASDVVAHEAGHSILDIVCPAYWDADTLQVGGIHESFGDLSALFFILVQDDLVDKLVVSTKGDLHRGNFASFMAEEFGRGLGYSSSLRDADKDYKMNEVEPEVHAIAEVFTGAIYDTLVSGFEDAFDAYRGRYRMAQMLQDTGDFLRRLTLHALIKNDNANTTYQSIAKTMIDLSDVYAQSASPYVKDFNWKVYLHDEFSRRDVLTDPSPKMLKAARMETNLDKEYGICGTHYHKIEKEEEQGI